MKKRNTSDWQSWAENAVADAKSVHRPQQIPLLPRHGIYLLSMDGDGQRFARLFRQAWAKLPLSSRRRLLEHWRVRRRLFANLLDDIAPSKCCLPFDVAWMDGLCDHAVERVLMHELTTSASGNKSEVKQ